MSKEKLDLEKRFELKNCVSELKVSDVADPAKVLVKLVKGDELKDDPVVGKITRLNESISQEVSKRLVFYYIKDEKKLDFKLIKKIVSEMLSKFAKEDLQFDLESFVTESLTIEKAFKLVAETIFLERFKPFSLKSEKKGKDENKKKATVTLVTKLKDTEVIVEEVRKVVSRINLVKSLQILPPNIANSEFLADRYQRFLLKSSKIKTKVLGREELTEKGMGLLLAVNRGSEYEPRLVVAEFNNNPESKEKIALVGKGITFDSGGYNLKPSASMSEMKFDMSGSAIVAAVVSLAAELDLKVNIVGLMPLTDNKIGKKAGTPDSV